jgi:hypothetical protein
VKIQIFVLPEASVLMTVAAIIRAASYQKDLEQHYPTLRGVQASVAP